MYLEIITPEKKLFSGEAELVRLPGTGGSFEILMKQAPQITTLAERKIKVKEPNGHITQNEITGGKVEIKSNNIIVLVDSSGLA